MHNMPPVIRQSSRLEMLTQYYRDCQPVRNGDSCTFEMTQLAARAALSALLNESRWYVLAQSERVHMLHGHAEPT